MNSEAKLREALVAYRDALTAAANAARAARDELQSDVLVATLAPFQALQQAAGDPGLMTSSVTIAIQALDDRAAALAQSG